MCPIANYHYDAHDDAHPAHDPRVPGHIHAFSLQPMCPKSRHLQPQLWVIATLYSPLPHSGPLPCIPSPDPCIPTSHLSWYVLPALYMLPTHGDLPPPLFVLRLPPPPITLVTWPLLLTTMLPYNHAAP